MWRVVAIFRAKFLHVLQSDSSSLCVEREGTCYFVYLLLAYAEARVVLSEFVFIFEFLSTDMSAYCKDTGSHKYRYMHSS